MIELVVDHREQKLKELLSNVEGISFEALEHGDVVLREDGETFMVFERKTLTDLKASMCDGRYRSQKARNLEVFSASMLYYIIEGDIDYQGADACIVGAVVNTMIRDGIGVFVTKNIHDTKALLIAVFQRVTKDPQLYKRDANCSSTTEVAAPLRAKHVPTFVNILCQVPGISKKTAEAIYEKYPTFKILHDALVEVPIESRCKMITNVTTTDGKGKSRKLSTKVAENLVEAIFG